MPGRGEKAGSATAMFTLLELAEQMLEKAHQAELDAKKPKA